MTGKASPQVASLTLTDISGATFTVCSHELSAAPTHETDTCAYRLVAWTGPSGGYLEPETETAKLRPLGFPGTTGAECDRVVEGSGNV